MLTLSVQGISFDFCSCLNFYTAEVLLAYGIAPSESLTAIALLNGAEILFCIRCISRPFGKKT